MSALGYPDKKIVVIPNGFDTDLYKPDPAARITARQALGIDPDTALIGIVARFDPQKDHRNFIEAARRLHQVMPDVHFVFIGRGMDPSNLTLTGWLSELLPVCHLLGPRDDIPMWMAALDLFSLSSAYGEAFPLVVGEAMSCGVPCIATDVGDTASLINNYGQVVPPRDPLALAQAWEIWLKLPAAERNSVGIQARQHIVDNYSIGHIAREYSQLYSQVVNPRPQA